MPAVPVAPGPAPGSEIVGKLDGARAAAAAPPPTWGRRFLLLPPPWPLLLPLRSGPPRPRSTDVLRPTWGRRLSPPEDEGDGREGAEVEGRDTDEV